MYEIFYFYSKSKKINQTQVSMSFDFLLPHYFDKLRPRVNLRINVQRTMGHKMELYISYVYVLIF